MFHLGLTGYPLSHSLSPKIHTAALKACDLEGDYSLFPVHPDDKDGLKVLLDRVRTGELTGLNITIPHKQNVFEFLDELTPTARAIGAVNTIYVRDEKLIGDNTDALGFLSDLNKFLAESPSPYGRGEGAREKFALVLGAGGSARAIVYALVKDGWQVTIAARRIEQAQELAIQFESIRALGFDFQEFHLMNFHLIVNTTPVGMFPKVDESPWSAKIPLPKSAAIYDLVYNPRETKLVKDACAQKMKATTGLGMLVEQAALAFEIWTGHNPPRKIMFDSVVE